MDEITPGWWFPRPYPEGWHLWRGVTGLKYARKLKRSPTIVVRGADADGGPSDA